MRDFISAILPDIPPALLAGDAVDRVASAAALLPDEAGTGMFGLEVALDHDRPEADFLASFFAANDGARLLSRAPIASDLAEDPAWRSVRALARRWETDLAGRIDNVWLEFDSTSEHFRSPSLFFRPLGDRREKAGSCRAAFETLLTEPLRSAVLSNLERHLDELQREGDLFQVGVMLPRNAPAVRLCLMTERRGMKDVLARLGIAIDDETLAPFTSPLTGVFERGALHLDLGELFSDSVGLECYLRPRVQTEATLARNGLLELLGSRGLATPKRLAALPAYPGVRYPSADRGWPAVLDADLRLRNERQRSCLARYVHHVKLSFRETGIAAKAYLAVQHLERDAGI